MTTIITLHGTNDTQPSNMGQQWWQRESPFEAKLNALIQHSDEPIDVQPFRWTGKNSESDRRAEGVRLYNYLQNEFEAKQRSYHLLAHSHGGSVIREALLESIVQDKPLEELRSWTTVGTPFLNFKQSQLLFSRMGLVGRVLFVFVVIYCLAAVFAMFSDDCNANFDFRKQCWGSGAVVEKDMDFDQVLERAKAITFLDDDGPSLFRAWGDVRAEPKQFVFEPYPIEFSAAQGLLADPAFTESKSVWALKPTRLVKYGDAVFESRDRGTIKSVLGRELEQKIPLDLCRNQKLLAPVYAQQFVDEYCSNGEFEPDYITSSYQYLPRKLNFAIWSDEKYAYKNMLLGVSISIEQDIDTYEVVLERHYFLPRKVAFDKRPVWDSGLFLALVLGVAMILYIIARQVLVRRDRRHEKTTIDRFISTYRSRWYSFSHQEDEVINAISHVHAVRSDIAPKNFLAGTLATFVSMILLAAFFTTRWPYQAFIALEDAVCKITEDERREICRSNWDLINTVETGVENPYNALEGLYFAVVNIAASGEPIRTISQTGYPVLANLLVLTVVVLMALLVGRVLEIYAVPVARSLLNSNIDGALKATAFGHDVAGEVPDGAGIAPYNMNDLWTPLSGPVDEALKGHVAGKVDSLVIRMRRLLGIADGEDGTFDVGPFYDAVTWNELIHTSYFRVEEVQKIIAAALIDTGDFSARSSFRDADVVKTWLNDMRK